MGGRPPIILLNEAAEAAEKNQISVYSHCPIPGTINNVEATVERVKSALDSYLSLKVSSFIRFFKDLSIRDKNNA